MDSVLGMHYGTDESKKYLAGAFKFKVKQMEVFMVIFDWMLLKLTNYDSYHLSH